ncbi:hypothetical protein SLEP1_g53375 [Rubroshorea leprosula]|uniref:Secreted protein n=1 Tax=Rubroshorea leprosula TaxID=152421 RepID=A0AAV5MBL0_9ROSI|nr:hypothetical protein SLEP1_g53375 [Rubroshorea leprosula]
MLCLFAVSCSVRCRSGGLLSPPADLWRRVRGLPDLTPTAALLVPTDCRRFLLPPPSQNDVVLAGDSFFFFLLAQCTGQIPVYRPVSEISTGTRNFDRYTGI